MLEFVHHSGASGGRDDQTRRKVRSQAMRDFRRRQREERDAAKISKKSLRVPSDASNGSASWQGRQRALSASSESTEASTRRISASRTRTLKTQKDGEIIFQAVPIQAQSVNHHHQHDQHQHDQHQHDPIKIVDHWQYDTGPLTSTSSQHWQMSSRDASPAIPQELSIWNHQTGDLFENPAQLQTMLGFCRSYIHWLIPGVDTDTAGRLLGQVWDQSKCSMLLAACCLASVGHLDAVQPGRPGGNYEVYKARVLRDISRRMKSPDTATSDETIGALACLLSFEMSRGSHEASTHLHGLRSIVNVKGGIRQLQLSGIPVVLETLDLIHAVLFDCQLALTDAGPVQQITPATVEKAFDLDNLPRIFSLLRREYDELYQSGSPYSQTLQNLDSILKAASICLRNEIVQGHTQDPKAVSDYRHALETFRNQAYIEAEDFRPDAQQLQRASYSAFSIHFNLIIARTPHKHRSNSEHTSNLLHSLRHIKNNTWKVMPYLRLLFLLTAAVSATGPTSKSFCKAELVRATYQMGSDESRRIEAFVLRFLEIYRTLERVERLATPPLQVLASTSTTHLEDVGEGHSVDYFGEGGGFDDGFATIGGTSVAKIAAATEANYDPSGTPHQLDAPAAMTTTVAADALVSPEMYNEHDVDPYLGYE